MTEEAERWKEKYLKSIEQQEKLERRWAARLDLLRRGLVRSTLAAEGSDKIVDQCMKEMREVIRSDNMDAGLAGLIPRLEKAVLDSEQRRETRMTQVSDALTALVTQLQTLPLPGEVARPLKKLAKKLDGGVSQSRELPPLLGELSGLQGRALNAVQKPDEEARPGFLQRLFGGRDEPQAEMATTAVAVTSPALAPVPAEAPAVQPTLPQDADELHALNVVPAPAVEEEPEPEPDIELPGPALVETVAVIPVAPAPVPEPEPAPVVEEAPAPELASVEPEEQPAEDVEPAQLPALADIIEEKTAPTPSPMRSSPVQSGGGPYRADPDRPARRPQPARAPQGPGPGDARTRCPRP